MASYPSQQAVEDRVESAGSSGLTAVPAAVRSQVRGRFLFVGDEKFYIRGATYGTFRPDADGHDYPDPQRVESDFCAMAQHGINTVRLYSVPPRWLLDLAAQHGLRVMIGLPWEQHVAFLDERSRRQDICRRVAEGVKACAGHPAVLAFTIGNEIPATIVRWYGRRRVERFLRMLYLAAKAEDPDALITYVNFPSTEYLQLPFLDFACFNVYLESQDQLVAYLGRLHSLHHDKPLVLGEVGMDSDRHGLDQQAAALDWQIRTGFASGCAGLFVFAWTDEWHRGGYDVDDWSFGVTDRQRSPKPALEAMSGAFAHVPLADDVDWPFISVILCSYNGSATIAETCEGLARLDYPNCEVIVVDDGSTDDTPDIARRYDFNVVTVANGGLSRARNIGLEHANGSIVAYIDDDAWPDPHWLKYIAWTFMTSDHVAVGGPNISPPEDGLAAECISHAPGGATAVLLTDTSAEHLPGCNMAFRRDALQSVGGFDARFRIAGDDVDVCWKLQEQGWTLGYHPSALVWHHRRPSIRAYLRQQRNYGRAEAMLEQKWPHKYNSLGHVSWGGQLYGNGIRNWLDERGRVHHGVWGLEPFQRMDVEPPGFWRSLPYMPEWYMATALLVAAGICGALFYPPLLLTLPLLLIALVVPIRQAWQRAATISVIRPTASRWTRLRLRLTTALLHLAQPIARLQGRFFSGLTPWRGRHYRRWLRPTRRQHEIWSEKWMDPEARLEAFERTAQRIGPMPSRGDDHARWDFEIKGGMFGSVRVLMAIEEHGEGKQLLRLSAWPQVSPGPLVLVGCCVAACVIAGVLDLMVLAIVLGTLALLTSVRAVRDCAVASAAYVDVVSEWTDTTDDAIDVSDNAEPSDGDGWEDSAS